MALSYFWTARFAVARVLRRTANRIAPLNAYPRREARA